MPTISIADLLTKHYPADCTKWGRWVYEPATLTLDLYSQPGGKENWLYETDLEDLVDEASVLRDILHFAGKAWARPEDLAGLVLAIKDCLGLHAGVLDIGPASTADALRARVEKNLAG